MKIDIKRAYDPYKKTDGTRVLVDRLWPRGVRKQDAHIDLWAKDLTPSATLRTWFHTDPEGRYGDFVKKYKQELSKNKPAARQILDAKKHYTLVTAAKDVEHSHVPTLVAFLKKL